MKTLTVALFALLLLSGCGRRIMAPNAHPTPLGPVTVATIGQALNEYDYTHHTEEDFWNEHRAWRPIYDAAVSADLHEWAAKNGYTYP